MTKTILIYGAIAGFFTIGVMTGAMAVTGKHGSVALGFLTMFVAFSLIFVAVKRRRDVVCGGVIKFIPAFLMGLGIAVVASIAYVIGWEAYLVATDNRFMADYAAAHIEAKRAAGVTGAALAAEVAKMETMKAQYDNPLFRLPITFTEIFPVGLLVALVTAALLRNPRILPARA
jgi:hypothetical protein